MPERPDTAGNHLLLIRSSEPLLKGANRRRFLAQLEQNLRRLLSGLRTSKPRRLSGRTCIGLRHIEDWPAARERLARLYGISNFSLGYGTKPTFEALQVAAERHLPGEAPGTFRVRCHRVDKSFPMTSPQIEKQLGFFIGQRTGWPVDLKYPALEVRVEILAHRFYLSFGVEPGPGGLPTGTSGRVVALLSGGIDSPVAAARILKRGARIHFLHFSGEPFQDQRSERKCRRLVQVLARSQLQTDLTVVPFGEIQRQVVIATPGPVRIVIYRRLMLRIAERLACKWRAAALVTGGSLGQVASQTLSNLAIIDRATEMPVLRPLVGMDKQEIVTEARALETYPISILPDGDCCQLFVPKKVATWVSHKQLQEIESRLDIEALVQLGCEGMRQQSFSYPVLSASDGH